MKDDMKFSNDMQMLAEVIGRELTIKVIEELGGAGLYVPQDKNNKILRYYKETGESAKRIAKHFGVSERMVYRAIAAQKDDERH